eukprot:CAMPEP_0173383274 /NCGR_PEP_ID=MMETSP1356-20130122/5833_1 /TAXON_ID=77927 ORGANISM="Hemiselmis virescens, Strain PCC157" /NCGR_SAMPLE_ID=MMETSP1356 /ASSEMBLY_ACC=CAM_ASM_000847 /LENGTH=301 /DNA_ID=CAMNT_0014338057 /DNA_START=245 /DNA_END=1147 /DNA_ORIENTATION=-
MADVVNTLLSIFKNIHAKHELMEQVGSMLKVLTAHAKSVVDTLEKASSSTMDKEACADLMTAGVELQLMIKQYERQGCFWRMWRADASQATIKDLKGRIDDAVSRINLNVMLGMEAKINQLLQMQQQQPHQQLQLHAQLQQLRVEQQQQQHLQQMLEDFLHGDDDGDDDATPALCEAVEEGNVGRVKSLLQGGADIEERDGRGWTPLHHAAADGHVDVAKCLLDGSADKEAKTMKGCTPLHHAAHRGHVDIVKCLLGGRRADTEAKEHDGWTPLHFAANKGHVDVVKCLLAGGCNKDAKEK